jgi:hypothetical protein
MLLYAGKYLYLVWPNSLCEIASQRLFLAHSRRNEILEQNPELAEELLSEIDRMREEKERLEQESLKLQAEAVRLEQELASSQHTESQQPPRIWGDQTAYSQFQQQQQHSALPPATDDSAASQESVNGALDNSSHNVSSTVELDEYLRAPSSSASAASKADNNKTSADFSLKTFVQEVIAEFEKNARRVTSLILPVVKPFFSAGNIAWRYFKIFFQGAKEQLKKYQKAGNSDQSDSSKQQER